MSRRAPYLLTLWLAAGPACNCSPEEARQQEARRDLLRPPDRAQKLAEAREQLRLTDDDGKLLESEETVAGIIMPRGLTLHRKFEREWYYRSKVVSVEQLQKYFAVRLFTGQIERIGDETVRFVAGRPKDTKGAPPVHVRVGPVTNLTGTAEVYLRQTQRPKGKAPPESEVRKQMELIRKHAD